MNEADFRRRLEAGEFDNWSSSQIQDNVRSGEIDPMQALRITTRQTRLRAALITVQDVANIYARKYSPFNPDVVRLYSPQYWYNYYLTQAACLAAGSANRDLLPALNAIFDKRQEQTDLGFRLDLKPGMVPVEAETGNPMQPYTYSFATPAACSAWNRVLTALLKSGFRAIPGKNAGPSPYPFLQDCLLEERRVKELVDHLSSSGFRHDQRIFWRGDGRSTLYKTGLLRTVDDQAVVKKCCLDQAWNPYSEDSIKSMIWLRLGNTDADYYTAISLATDFHTATCFPNVNDPKAYNGIPSKPLAPWSEEELRNANAGKVLRRVKTSENNLPHNRVVTRSYLYMFAINSGVVVSTDIFGQYKPEGSQDFRRYPEKSIEGLPKETFMGMIPVLRVWHGVNQESIFTLLPNPKEPPLFWLDDDTLKHRFGRKGMENIKREFLKGLNEVEAKLSLCWAATGHTKHPEISKSSTDFAILD